MTAIFAHRGHHHEAPENSVAAVAAARDIRADGVEIDVWLTADGHLVVNHDRTVGGLALPASRRADLVHGLAAPAELGEVLTAAGGLRINVEIKSTRSRAYNLAVAEAVAGFLDDSPWSSQCLVSSFSLEICEAVRAASPQRRVGWLIQRQGAAQALDRVSDSALTSLHLPFARVREPVARAARDRGVDLHVWTPNLERDIGRMLELEVGALITDDVPLAQRMRDSSGLPTSG